MNRLRQLAILITCLWFAQSCGVSESRSDLAIGGGSALLSPASSVVRIANKNQSICSGVLVAADLVITAAHCLKSEDASLYTVVFPLNASDKLRSVVEFKRVKPDSLAYFPNFDIAWIRLASPAPTPYVAAKILGETRNVALNSGLTLVGSANETPCHPADARCNMVKLSVSLKSTWSSAHLISLAVVDSVNPTDSSGTCPGDSGGPAFVSYQGQDLIYGLVAGKDPIFTGGMSSSCGSPRSVLTRIGEYQTWIEASSGRKLSVVDPSPNPLDLDFLSDGSNQDVTYATWEDWFAKPSSSDKAWTTVHKILEQTVLEFQTRMTQIERAQLFQTGGKSWIEQITKLQSLTLGFPDQAIAIEDLRPLIALKNLKDLTFLARNYIGLDVLENLERLTSLSIVGRVVTRTEQGTFQWAQLSSSHLETLKLSQVAAANLTNIVWQNLPNLNSLVISSPLGKILASVLHEENLGGLNNLQLQEFSCNQTAWPKAEMPNLKSLSLRSTVSAPESDIACIRWDLLPNLSQLSIQGYKIDLRNLTGILPPALLEQVRKQNP